jgi:hypothetical protein
MEKDKSLLNNAMYYGLFFGLFLVVLSIITNTFVTDVEKLQISKFLSLLTIVFYFIGITICTIHFRKNRLGNIISYKHAFTFGMLVMFYASFIVALYLFVFTKWINTDFINLTNEINKSIQIEKLQSKKISDEEIDVALMMMDKFSIKSPLALSVVTIFGGLFWGVLVSLLTSIFTKKAATNPFSEISNTEE